MFCIPAPKGRQSAPPVLINTLRWPSSPSGHWFFLPREGREPKLRRGRSTDQGILLHRALWLQRPSPQSLTLHKQLGSDLPAARPGLLSSSVRRHPPSHRGFPSWARQTITALASSKKGAVNLHAWLGRRAPWGAGGRDVWSGRDSFSCRPFCCPRAQQAGKWTDGGGWARFGACRKLGDSPPTLCSLCGFSKAAQPAASPATSHPDLSGWPCQGTSVLTCGIQPRARLCQDMSERQPPPPSSTFQRLPKTSF